MSLISAGQSFIFSTIVYLSRPDSTVLVLVLVHSQHRSLREKAVKIQTDTFRDELVNITVHLAIFPSGGGADQKQIFFVFALQGKAHVVGNVHNASNNK